MRVGDVVINPFVIKDFKTAPNPMCKSMIIHIGQMYTRCLRYDGKVTTYYTSDVKKWKVVRNVNLYEIMFSSPKGRCDHCFTKYISEEVEDD